MGLRQLVALVVVVSATSCAAQAAAPVEPPVQDGERLRAYADLRCVQAGERLDQVPLPPGEQVDAISMTPTFAASARVHRDLLGELQALPAPAQDAAPFAALLRSAGGFTAALQEASDAAARGDLEATLERLDRAEGGLVDTSQRAVAFGLKNCYTTEMVR